MCIICEAWIDMKKHQQHLTNTKSQQVAQTWHTSFKDRMWQNPVFSYDANIPSHKAEAIKYI
jgi:quinol monooxygenase YgiN